MPSGSNLIFAGSLAQNGYGAVLQSSGTFSRSVGTSIQWTGDGGFAANGGTLTVAMSPGVPLVWNNNTLGTGTPGFVPDGSVLTFGSPTANNQVNFTDSIDLNGEIRQIDVAAGAGGDSALISGNITDGAHGGGGGIAKTGNGLLILAGTNAYTGGTTIDAGTLVATSPFSLPGGGSLTISAGGTFVFDPSFAGAAATPVASGAAVSAVPEPGTLALLIAGLVVGFGLWRGRKMN